MKESCIITKSQNHLVWIRPLRSLSQTINLTLPSPPLKHVIKTTLTPPAIEIQPLHWAACSSIRRPFH